jgi:RNA polymerase sigma-70 factor (ECF subfamily)
VLREDFAGLLARAQRGDEAAFARLWADLNPALVRYLRLEPESSAEDLAAETWVTVVKGLARFRGDETAWRAWVFTTARRRALDEARRRSRRPRPAPVELLDDVPAAEAPADDLAEALHLLRLLPPAQAEVLALRVIAGLPVETVARMVGRSPGAVRVAAHRGLRTLAALVAPGASVPAGPGPVRRRG